MSSAILIYDGSRREEVMVLSMPYYYFYYSTSSCHSPTSQAKAKGGRVAKIFVELQRKSFHMIGGCILGSVYHYGLKYGYLSSAYLGDNTISSGSNPSVMEMLDDGSGSGRRPFDAGAAYLSLCFLVWMLEALRLQCAPGIYIYRGGGDRWSSDGSSTS